MKNWVSVAAFLFCFASHAQAQSASCEAENEAIAAAPKDAPAAELYRARDKCNQRIASSYQVPTPITAKPPTNRGDTGLQEPLNDSHGFHDCGDGGQTNIPCDRLAALEHGKTAKDFAPRHDNGLQELLNEHWERLLGNDVVTFSYTSQNIMRDNNNAAHLSVRSITTLASGVRKMHIDIGYMPCKQGMPVPSSFVITTTADLIVESDNKAALDPVMHDDDGRPFAVDILKGSILETLARRVCAAN